MSRHLLGFLYPISRLISYSVFEEEQKIREGLYMMGLEDGIFHLSWFIAYDLQVGSLFFCIFILSTQLSNQDFPIYLLDLTSHVVGEFPYFQLPLDVRVYLYLIHVFDNDFLSHLPNFNAQVVGQFLRSQVPLDIRVYLYLIHVSDNDFLSHLPDLIAQVVGQFPVPSCL
ncbi:unnamed protein product [Prunus armeniaca]|uniref:Uncharacterized protein n=1 Tax=Prunus armeniaca TaxID=36596 RepID=A0A6J5VDG8_PRUAR|nr:unnamed protein product [Prunus armeniaca]